MDWLTVLWERSAQIEGLFPQQSIAKDRLMNGIAEVRS